MVLFNELPPALAEYSAQLFIVNQTLQRFSKSGRVIWSNTNSSLANCALRILSFRTVNNFSEQIHHPAHCRRNHGPRVQHRFVYSDGYGREVQRKSQAEPDAQGRAQWIGSGWRIFDNKGKVVREYEPFFSTAEQSGDTGH